MAKIIIEVPDHIEAEILYMQVDKKLAKEASDKSSIASDLFVQGWESLVATGKIKPRK